jgi:hypothetical protein
MSNLRFERLAGDARSLADQLGSQTTETLIRAVSGVQQAASAPAEVAREGAGAAGNQIGQAVHGVADGVQNVALPTPSARMAWRAGRVLGRIEGAIRLAVFGLKVWRRTRKRAGQTRQAQAGVRPALQWGPSVLASVYLATQLWARIRRRGLQAG